MAFVMMMDSICKTTWPLKFVLLRYLKVKFPMTNEEFKENWLDNYTVFDAIV